MTMSHRSIPNGAYCFFIDGHDVLPSLRRCPTLPSKDCNPSGINHHKPKPPLFFLVEQHRICGSEVGHGGEGGGGRSHQLKITLSRPECQAHRPRFLRFLLRLIRSHQSLPCWLLCERTSVSPHPPKHPRH